MNNTQARVIDPILSKVVRGYQQEGMVGEKLFPRVPVESYGGNVIQFGKESFRLVNTKRAPGSATARINFGYQGIPYAIVPSALEATVPGEVMQDASKVPGIDLAGRSVSVVKGVMALSHEHECATLATNPANYGNDNKTKFTTSNSWGVGDSDPIRDFKKAKAAIQSATGMRPNRLILGPTALAALQVHPKIIEWIKHTNATEVSIDMLKRIIGVQEIIEAPAVVANGESLGFVWGDHAILAYVSDAPLLSKELPSYGYTYAIEGHPIVEKPYWDENTKSWVYGVSDDCTPVIAGADAGFLFESAGAGFLFE